MWKGLFVQRTGIGVSTPQECLTWDTLESSGHPEGDAVVSLGNKGSDSLFLCLIAHCFQTSPLPFYLVHPIWEVDRLRRSLLKYLCGIPTAQVSAQPHAGILQPAHQLTKINPLPSQAIFLLAGEACLDLPRKLHYVSNKSFHTFLGGVVSVTSSVLTSKPNFRENTPWFRRVPQHHVASRTLGR